MKLWRTKFVNDLAQGKPQYTNQTPKILFMVNTYDEFEIDSDECQLTMQDIACDLKLEMPDLDIPDLCLKELPKQHKLLCFFDYAHYLQNPDKQPWEIILDSFHKRGLSLTFGYTGMPGVAGFELVITKKFAPHYHAVFLDAAEDFLANYFGKKGYLGSTSIATQTTNVPQIFALALIDDQGNYFLTLPIAIKHLKRIHLPKIKTTVKTLNNMLKHTPLITSGQTQVYQAYFRTDYHNNQSILFDCVPDLYEDEINEYLPQLVAKLKLAKTTHSKKTKFPGLSNAQIKMLFDDQRANLLFWALQNHQSKLANNNVDNLFKRVII